MIEHEITDITSVQFFPERNIAAVVSRLPDSDMVQFYFVKAKLGQEIHFRARLSNGLTKDTSLVL